MKRQTTTVEPGRIFVETWAGEYGSPLQLDEDDPANGRATILEEEGFDFIEPARNHEPVPLAFVDGVRRQEAPLSRWIAGRSVPGLAGAYAFGSVVALPGKPVEFGPCHAKRLVIWSGGETGDLPDVDGGWRWETDATGETGPQAPLHRLQEMMRRGEAELAAALASAGFLVLTDGTLFYASSHERKGVAGYVKTHHVRLLPVDDARRLPDLPAGVRTTIFRTDSNRYSCYLRLAPIRGQQAPMSGIVRLEFAGSLPLSDVRALADRFATLLPSYAGVAHRDPRAPQNLQPIGALETRLRHLLGDARLAERAVRDAVALLAHHAGDIDDR